MPRYIVKIKDKYLDWSAVVDAPLTYGMSKEKFKEYYKHEYGTSSLDEFETRMKRVEEKGTSSIIDENVRDTVEFNRAGKNESQLTFDEIYEQYCSNTAT